MVDRTIVDGEGDVILSLRHEQLVHHGPAVEVASYLVTSRVLCLVSPVFRAMMKGSFKESTQLKESLAEPCTIPIYDDDIEAMTVFCKAAHFKDCAMLFRPPTSWMDKFAIVCDKYGSTDAFRHHAACWLHEWSSLHRSVKIHASDIDDMCRLLAFASIFKLEVEFSEVAWLLFLHHEGSFLSPNAQVHLIAEHPLVDPDLITQLDLRRQEHCRNIHRAIISPLLWDWSTLQHDGCWRAAKVIGRYSANLKELLGQEPYDFQFSNYKFNDIVEKVKTMPHLSARDVQCGHRTKCACFGDPWKDVVDDLKNAIEEIEKDSKSFFRLIRDSGSKSDIICNTL